MSGGRLEWCSGVPSVLGYHMVLLEGLYMQDQRSSGRPRDKVRSCVAIQVLLRTNRSIDEYCPECEVCVDQFSGLVQEV